MAAEGGRLGAVRALLQGGAVLEAAAAGRGETALAVAVRAGHVDVVRELLARGAVDTPSGVSVLQEEEDDDEEEEEEEAEEEEGAATDTGTPGESSASHERSVSSTGCVS
jgi:ankyrin repeat protein